MFTPTHSAITAARAKAARTGVNNLAKQWGAEGGVPARRVGFTATCWERKGAAKASWFSYRPVKNSPGGPFMGEPSLELSFLCLLDRSSLRAAPTPVHPAPLSPSPQLLAAPLAPSCIPPAHSQFLLPFLLFLRSTSPPPVLSLSLASPPSPAAFSPPALSQTLSSITLAGEAPKEQTASCFLLCG